MEQQDHRYSSDDEDEDDEENFPEQRFVPPQLLEIVHQHTRTSEEMLHRPEVLENWLYNWQTKERKIPEALVSAGNAIKLIENAFHNLQEFHDNLRLVSPDLKPEGLLAVDKLAYRAIKSYSGIIRQLEEKINAIRLYWFPETVDQLKLGAYKSVRQFVQDYYIDDPSISLTCSTCLEELTQPVIFRRRCEMNPLLKRTCDLPPCECTLPTICLNCALDHILRNGIHEGKSSVRCPACRGEVCIYDVQEVNLLTARGDDREAILAELNELEKLRQEIAAEREALERERQ